VARRTLSHFHMPYIEFFVCLVSHCWGYAAMRGGGFLTDEEKKVRDWVFGTWMIGFGRCRVKLRIGLLTLGSVCLEEESMFTYYIYDCLLSIGFEFKACCGNFFSLRGLTTGLLS
jgi:hypothetical protein